jgi:hypothetical protein
MHTHSTHTHTPPHPPSQADLNEISVKAILAALKDRFKVGAGVLLGSVVRSVVGYC